MTPEEKLMLERLEAEAKKVGAVAIYHGQGHFQIRGKLIANYYPFSKKQTLYVSQTKYPKRFQTPEKAVLAAMLPPPVAPLEKREARGRKSRKTRQWMMRFTNTCHWCGKVLTLDTSTIDHHIPLARGGLDNANNRVLACKPCNRGRGADMPELTENVINEALD